MTIETHTTEITAAEAVALLRDAAQQMRCRAVPATGLNWNSDYGTAVYTVDTNETGPTAVVTNAKAADIVHIAGWGPATALAVADLLDYAAEEIEADRWKTWHSRSAKALAVARAYLDAGWDSLPYQT